MKKIIFLFLVYQIVTISQGKDTLKVGRIKIDKVVPVMKLSLYTDPVKVSDTAKVLIKDSDLFLFRKDDFYGFIDSAGNIIIKPQFYFAKDFSEGLAYADLGYTRGFIDKTGKLVIDLRSYTSDYFSDGVALINFNMVGTDGGGMNLYKYIDKDANWLFKQSYGYATPFKDGFALVKSKEGVRVISKEKMIAELYGDITPFAFSEGLARIRKKASNNYKWGYIDTTGKVVIEPIFDNAYDFSEGMAVVSKVDTTERNIINYYGYINKQGKIAISLLYSEATDFSGGLAMLRIDSTCIGIDKYGNEIFSLNKFYFGVGFARCKFSEGLARGKFYRPGKSMSGYIDTTGNMSIAIEYSQADNFKNGLARIWQNSYGEWSYIDKNGEIIFNPDSISSSIIPDSLKTYRSKGAVQ